MNTIQKLGVGLGASAIVLGGVAGLSSIAQAADPTAAPTPSSTATPGTDQGTRPEGRGGKHGGGVKGADAAALAQKLGIDEAKVTEALKTAREALKPAAGTTPTARPDKAESQAKLATELAKALGIDEAKVTEALAAVRADHQAAEAAALKTRLDQAVTDGKLTQAEADAVAKAVQAGVIGGGGRR